MTVTSPRVSPTTRSGIGTSLKAALAKPLAPYYLILGSTVMLTALGLVMVLSASSVESYAASGNSWAIAQRQAMWVVIGVPALVVASRLPATWFRRLAVPILVLSIVLLVLVLVPGIGVSVNGNQNWIEIGGSFRIQPAEAAKFALVLWSADLLTRKRKLLHQNKHLLIPLLPVAAVIIGLVLLGGDLGTSLILMAIVAGMLFIAGAPLRVFRRARRTGACPDPVHDLSTQCPPVAAAVVPRPLRRLRGDRVAGRAQHVRARLRWLVGRWTWGQSREVGQPA